MQGRGGKGISCYKTTDKNPISIISATMISNEDNVLIMGNKNSICISATDIPLISRQALGNILIKDNIKSVTKI